MSVDDPTSFSLEDVEFQSSGSRRIKFDPYDPSGPEIDSALDQLRGAIWGAHEIPVGPAILWRSLKDTIYRVMLQMRKRHDRQVEDLTRECERIHKERLSVSRELERIRAQQLSQSASPEQLVRALKNIDGMFPRESMGRQRAHDLLVMWAKAPRNA